MKTGKNYPSQTLAGLVRVSCCALLMMAALNAVAAPPPGSLEYYAEIEMSKEQLLTADQYEFLKTILPPEYYDRADFYIDQVRSGHLYEYRAKLWADLAASSSTRATNVFLTLPGGQVRVGTLNDDNDLEFPGWPDRYYTFAELKAAVPPGTYQILAFFHEGAGTNYTAVLPDYNETSFPPFVPGEFTWNPAPGEPLVLNWDTIPDVDEYEVYGQEFPIGPDLFSTGNIFPTHPSSLTTVVEGSVVNTNFYSVFIQAERDVNSGAFTHEFSSWTGYYFLPAKLFNPSKGPGSDFQCEVEGGFGTSYRVEGSTNMIHWTSLGVTTVGSNGRFSFSDTSSASIPNRVYRAVWAPAP
jgi:hypothetical protein